MATGPAGPPRLGAEAVARATEGAVAEVCTGRAFVIVSCLHSSQIMFTFTVMDNRRNTVHLIP